MSAMSPLVLPIISGPASLKLDSIEVRWAGNSGVGSGAECMLLTGLYDCGGKAMLVVLPFNGGAVKVKAVWGDAVVTCWVGIQLWL